MLYNSGADDLQEQFDSQIRDVEGKNSKGQVVEGMQYRLVSAKQLLSGTQPRVFLAIQYFGAKQNPATFSATNPKTNSSLPMGARQRLQGTPSKEKVTYYWVLWGRCLLSNTMVAVSTSNEEEKRHIKSFSRLFQVWIGDVLLVCSPETGMNLGEDYEHATLFIKTKRPIVPIIVAPTQSSILSSLSCHPANGVNLLPLLDTPFQAAMLKVKHLVMKPFDFFVSAKNIKVLDTALSKACANDNGCDRAFPTQMKCDLCGTERKTLSEGGDTLMVTLEAEVEYGDGSMKYDFTTYSYVALRQFTTPAAFEHIKKCHDLNSAEMMLTLRAVVKMMAEQGLKVRILGMRAGAAPGEETEDSSDLISSDLMTGMNPAKAIRVIWPRVLFESVAQRDATLYSVVPLEEERDEEIIQGELVLERPPLRNRVSGAPPAAAAALPVRSADSTASVDGAGNGPAASSGP